MTLKIKILIGLLALSVLAVGCGPGRYYNKGMDRYGEGDYNKAVQEFYKALEKDKKGEFPDTPDRIVDCYLAISKQYYASDIYESVSAAEKAVSEADRLGAKPETKSRARDTLQKSKTELTRRASESRALLSKARLAIKGKYDIGSYISARDLLEQAVRIDPRNGEASTLLADVNRTIANIQRADDLTAQGDALLASGARTLRDIEKAKSSYDQALLAFDKCEKAKAGLARIAALTRQVKAAAADHFRRAGSLEQVRKWTECLKQLEECIRLDYTHSDAQAMLPRIRELSRAETEYNNTISEIKNKKALGIKSVEDADAAIALCDKAVLAYEDNGEASALKTELQKLRLDILSEADRHFQNGKAAMAAKQYEKARDEFRACLGKYAGHTEASRELATVSKILEKLDTARALVKEGDDLLALGKPYDARTKFLEARRLVPGLVDADAGLKKAEAAIAILKIEAERAFDAAELLVAQKNYEEALRKLDEAITKDPGNSRYTTRRTTVAGMLTRQHYDRGREYEKQYEWDKAAAEYKIASGYDRRYDRDYKRVLDEKEADRYASTAENTHTPRKEWYEAGACYKKARDLSASRKQQFGAKLNEMVGNLVKQADVEEVAGDYDQTLKLLDQAVSLESYPTLAARAKRLRDSVSKAKTRYDNALTYRRTRRYVAADKELEALITLLPKYRDAKTLLDSGRVYIDRARDHYDRAIRFEKQKQYEIALAEYEASLRECSDYPDSAKLAAELKTAKVEYDKGITYRNAKKLEEALAAFRKVSAVRNDYSDVRKQITEVGDALAAVRYHYGKGVGYQNQKAWKKACVEYDIVLGLIYKYKDTAARLAACRKQMGAP